ncbi:MAG: hypothetical protein ACI4WM_01005 [Erysipelotrichaceae bacterium]
MKLSQKFLFFIWSQLVFILLGVIEYFLLPYIVELFTLDWKVFAFVYIAVLVLINPFVARVICDRVSFKVK